MKKIILLFVFVLGYTFSYAQQPKTEPVKKQFKGDLPKVKITKGQFKDPVLKLAETITADDIKTHLDILASDEYEGRETGQPGQRKAAQYIADHFKNLGLPELIGDSYYQKIGFKFERLTSSQVKVGDKDYRMNWDYLAPLTGNKAAEINTKEVLYLGYGISDKKYDDYKNVVVSGQTIMIFDGEPKSKKGKSHVTGSKENSDWTLEKKLALAADKGVKAVLVIVPKIQDVTKSKNDASLRGVITMETEDNPVKDNISYFYISKEVAEAIVGKKKKQFLKTRKKTTKKGRPASLRFNTDLSLGMEKETKTIYGENVLGLVEGTDPKLKDEMIIVTAHYDHLGVRGDEIFNGADDNGSGTSTVLDVAEAFAKARDSKVGPRRSVLFMLVSGEEKGLLGSKYYVEHPVFPLENAVANINVDMVGRSDEKYKDNPNYIYVIGADRLSTELHDINEAANEKYVNLKLDYTYNEEDDPNRYYYRSDHYNFAERGIPAVFYFSGVHVDYHQPSDTPEKINFQKTEKVGRLVFHTIWQLANQDKRIEVDVKPKK